MRKESLVGEIVQIYVAGGDCLIGTLLEIYKNGLLIDKVVTVAPVREGLAMNRVIDVDVEDFVIIAGSYTLFKIKPESDMYVQYKNTVSCLTLPKGGSC